MERDSNSGLNRGGAWGALLVGGALAVAAVVAFAANTASTTATPAEREQAIDDQRDLPVGVYRMVVDGVATDVVYAGPREWLRIEHREPVLVVAVTGGYEYDIAPHDRVVLRQPAEIDGVVVPVYPHLSRAYLRALRAGDDPTPIGGDVTASDALHSGGEDLDVPHRVEVRYDGGSTSVSELMSIDPLEETPAEIVADYLEADFDVADVDPSAD